MHLLLKVNHKHYCEICDKLYFLKVNFFLTITAQMNVTYCMKNI